MGSTSTFDQLFSTVVCVLGAIYLARCTLGGVLYALGLLPGQVGSASRRCAAHVTPDLVRRVAVGVCGTVAVLGGSVGLANAAQAAPSPNPVAVLDRGPIATTPAPTKPGPVDPPVKAKPPLTENGSRTQTEHVVTDDDCLWSLAKKQLGPGATDQQIDAMWKRWYRANRHTIGSNPDVIVTGSRLVVPTTPIEATR